MQNESYRTTSIGAALSTVTSTTMTVLLLGSMGQGALAVALLAGAGLGFEILKWSSWKDSWKAHDAEQFDKRNIMACLCAAAVVMSVAASIATTRSNLAISSSGYLNALEQRTNLQIQIAQKQAAADACIAANRITLCARPLQNEITILQNDLTNLSIPAPDEATALVMEVGKITGLDFSDSATLVMALISIMLDASGLYFLFKQHESQAVTPKVTPSNAIESDVTQVIQAIQQGQIKRPSVREVRTLLNCAQGHAAIIARTCKQIEMSI